MSELEEYNNLRAVLGLLEYVKDPVPIYEKVGKWFCEHNKVTCEALHKYADEHGFPFG